MARLTIARDGIAEYLRLIEETPGRVPASTSWLDDALLAQAPGGRGWSAAQVLAHIRGCDEVWSYSIYAMLVEKEPVLAAVDARRWAEVAGYETMGFHEALQTFALKRAELVRVLRGLPQEAWGRTANIGGRAHSVFSQLRRMGKHEVEHCGQIEELTKWPGSSDEP